MCARWVGWGPRREWAGWEGAGKERLSRGGRVWVDKYLQSKMIGYFPPGRMMVLVWERGLMRSGQPIVIRTAYCTLAATHNTLLSTVVSTEFVLQPSLPMLIRIHLSKGLHKRNTAAVAWYNPWPIWEHGCLCWVCYMGTFPYEFSPFHLLWAVSNFAPISWSHSNSCSKH